MGRIVRNISLEEDSPMQENTQAINTTTNIKVKVYFS